MILMAVLYQAQSQVVYSERFNGSTLTSYTASNGAGSYTSMPASFYNINDGRYNNVGTSLNPNTPFNNSALKTAGWVVGTSTQEADTFMVSTSWLDTSANSVNRWVITPPVTITGSNSIIRWKAKCPDTKFRDGYEVYFTSNTSASLTANDFPVANRLFALSDNNTAGAGENSGWTGRSAYLGNLSGQTLRFAFRNNSKDRYQLWIDDIEVLNVSNSRDAEMNSVSAGKYILTNTNDTIRAVVGNLGATNIFTVTLNYMVGNSAVQSQVFTNSIGWGNSSLNSIDFSMPYYVTSPGRYKIKAWISSVNGLSDQNNLNDTAVFYTTAIATAMPKTVMVEQVVSAFDGESPDAIHKLLALQSNTNVIGVNIHTNDSLKRSSMASFVSDYFTSNNEATVDRKYYSDLNAVSISRSAYSARTSKRLSAVVPASVSIVNKAFNATTRELSFDVKVDFNGEVIGDYRLNAYLIENHVCGKLNDTTLNGFNQLNDYYSVPWSPYYQTGYFSQTANSYVLNTFQYRHQNVLIHAFDGAYGSTGTIPSSGGTANQSFSQTFTVTIPTATNGAQVYNVDNIYIVGFVAEGSSNKNERTVLNAGKTKLTPNAELIGLNELKDELQTFRMFPNPSSGKTYIAFNANETSSSIKVEVFDLLGKKATEFKAKKGDNGLFMDLSELANGTYFVRLSTDSDAKTSKLIIQH